MALEKCESLAGEAQKACKDSAEATYESAKERLRTQMSGNTGAAGSATAPNATTTPDATGTSGTSTTTTPNR